MPKLLVDPSFLQSVNVSVLPRSDNAFDLGSSNRRWRNIYGTYLEVVRSFSWSGSAYSNEIETGLVLKNLDSNSPYSPTIRFMQSNLPDSIVEIFSLGSGLLVRHSTTGGEYWSTSLSLTFGTATFSADIKPDSDNSYDLGTSDYRWRNLYVVNLYTGDINLNNGWKVTELPDGLVVKDPRGEEIFKITKDGIWFKGKKIVR